MRPIYAPANFQLNFDNIISVFRCVCFQALYACINILFYLKLNIEKVHTHREKKTFKNNSFYPVLFTQYRKLIDLLAFIDFILYQDPPLPPKKTFLNFPIPV